ncbi:hypothetical protein PROFUN_13824 [Planoprotostelium fungivorum]|uniref:Uncharacterized protein n=1 Tax=Planoprotostelium fungivorum TaxID=1890364 RepID=A0A2P6N2V8_9EUKA|nr:hypothetical protein PROFUN_13824 [Planoprotostelium fungivorum]
MSWFTKTNTTTKDGNPSAEDCRLFKDNMDFIISNLKFSLVHHEARTDGTMMEAWKQEKTMLEEQIKILERRPKNVDSSVEEVTAEHIRRYQNALVDVNNQMDSAKDTKESRRLEGMRDMHRNFVRSLESLVPLLKEKCPNEDWTKPPAL